MNIYTISVFNLVTTSTVEAFKKQARYIESVLLRTDTCAAHQCLPEEVGAQVVGDDQASPAIGLMQTFLLHGIIYDWIS